MLRRNESRKQLARLTLRDVLMQSAADYAERPALGTVDCCNIAEGNGSAQG
jgi:hypothetical protein